jgi:hypothetical protein
VITHLQALFDFRLAELHCIPDSSRLNLDVLSNSLRVDKQFNDKRQKTSIHTIFVSYLRSFTRQFRFVDVSPNLFDLQPTAMISGSALGVRAFTAPKSDLTMWCDDHDRTSAIGGSSCQADHLHCVTRRVPDETQRDTVCPQKVQLLDDSQFVPNRKS